MRSHFTRHRAVRALAALAVLAGMLSFSDPASAVHDEGFDLQGDVQSNSLTDWDDLFDATGSEKTLPTGIIATAFDDDYQLPDSTVYATGSKDELPIGGWQCKEANNVGDKVDLVNAYAAAARPTSGDSVNDLIVYFGSEISSPNGSRNAGLWLLQDENVGCSAANGKAQTWTGEHRDGDVFIVSAFTNGGTTANITVYEWAGSEESGALTLKGTFTDATCPPPTDGDDRACAIVNSAEVDPPWPAPDKNGGNLDVNTFFEGGVNLTDLGLETCFSSVVHNSRSSHETTATIFDFVADDFETCGAMTVSKYIDVDMSGGVNAGDVTTGSAVANWSISVTRDSDDVVVCSGTTGTDGELDCDAPGTLSNLIPGSYTITETQKTGFFNTDPGPFDEGATVSKTVNVGFGDTNVVLGNTCYVDKTFTINNVPTGADEPTSVTVAYDVDSGPNAGESGTVALTIADGTATGTLADDLTQLDVIDWSWYIDGDSDNAATGEDDETIGGGYPTCARSNSSSFTLTDVTGHKFKDANANGTNDGEPDLAGFSFELRRQSDDSLVDTATSGEDGEFTFDDVAPGEYYVQEVNVLTGWLQTAPSPNSVPVTIVLGQSTADAGDFGNTPLTDFDITVTSQTDSTDSTISCTGPSQGSGPGTLDSEQSDDSYSGDDLIVGTYECTIVIVDP